MEFLACLARWRLPLSCYFVLMSLVGFCCMGLDKRRARQGAWRVRERTFFVLALLGGAPGTILGMYAFHHKTRHWYFRLGLPAILVLQLALATYLLRGIWMF